jgi:hypothetical protein
MKLAVIMQVAFAFRKRREIGVSSISLPDGSMSMNVPLKLLSEVRDILKDYRKIPAVR